MSSIKHVFILFIFLLINRESLSKAIRELKETKNHEFNFLKKNITSDIKWIQNGIAIAGGNQFGNQLNQLYDPTGIAIDDDDQSIYIADSGNDRIIQWKFGEKAGRIIAGGNGRGNDKNQLDWPTDVVIDKKMNSIIICDLKNRRVVRWSLEKNEYGQILIPDIDCGGLKMDNHGDLYASDYVKNEIRKWSKENPKGIIVAGGNGKGNQLNQLNYPIYFFIDKNYSIYISDHLNNRVMKWKKDAKEGIIVAGGQGKGNLLTQLKDTSGVVVDHAENIYIVDSGNNRIIRWLKDAIKGQVIIGGIHNNGKEAHQFNYPTSLAFDRQGNLYVADFNNHRIQKFIIDHN